MQPLSTCIRKATLSDAEGVAFVHFESWKTTYPGIIPEEIISARTLERRIHQWTTQLSVDDDTRQLFVAETEGRIVAYAYFGRSRTPELPYTHELYAIYSLQSAQGQGIGRALVHIGTNWVIEQGGQSIMLWALKMNQSGRSFYDRIGGNVFTERIDPDFSTAIAEVGYGWNDLKILRETTNFTSFSIFPCVGP